MLCHAVKVIYYNHIIKNENSLYEEGEIFIYFIHLPLNW